MRRLAGILAVLLLAACSGTSPGGAPAAPPTPAPGAGADDGVAAGSPAGPGAGADGGVAAGSPAGPGAGADAQGGVAPPACAAFCDRLYACVPEGMRALALVQRTFPVDCAKRCAKLDPVSVACAPDHSCQELSNGECGGEVGSFVRNLGGP